MIFELFFIAVFLAAVVTIVTTVVSELRGQRKRALSLLTRLVVSTAIYLFVLVVVSLMSTQRFLPIGEDRCFDDWCVAVENVTIVSDLGLGDGIVQPDGEFYVVTLRLSNQSRGRPQRVSSAAVWLIDRTGRRYEVAIRGQEAFETENGPEPPLTSTMDVNQALRTVRVFDLPKDLHEVGLAIRHPVGPAPGLFIIGDDTSLFHKPTLVRLN